MKRTKFTKILSCVIMTVLIAAMALTAVACDKKAEGEKQFTFICTDGDGIQQVHDIVTDEETVGEALIEKGLIDGDEGQYGLYVKTVCGITADFDTDGTYWAFYIDGEYAMTGVEKTDIVSGATYEFKVEK